MPAHLALDAVAGAGLAALPFLLAEDEDHTAVIACCVGQGLFDIAAAPMTETRASFDKAEDERDQGEHWTQGPTRRGRQREQRQHDPSLAQQSHVGATTHPGQESTFGAVGPESDEKTGRPRDTGAHATPAV